jgi:hypothetical protein
MNLSSTIKSIQDIMRRDDGVDGDAQRIGQLTWMLYVVRHLLMRPSNGSSLFWLIALGGQLVHRPSLAPPIVQHSLGGLLADVVQLRVQPLRHWHHTGSIGDHGHTGFTNALTIRLSTRYHRP